MADSDDIKPFLSGQRRNVLGGLAAAYARGVSSAVFARISSGLDPEQVKIDGKAGALDGVLATGSGIQPPQILALAQDHKAAELIKPVKDDGEKEGKDEKEGKEGKEGKEAKETKDGKETKEEKETKESKDKEEKETKESKDKESKEEKETKEEKEPKDDKEKEQKEIKETKEFVMESGFESPTVAGVDFDGAFTRVGEPGELPVASFEAIARAHPDRVQLAVTRGSLF